MSEGVFGFSVGHVVRLRDGDGRHHTIKSFKKIEGIHSDDFYEVFFDDDSARDIIIPDNRCKDKFFTNMVKIDDE